MTRQPPRARAGAPSGGQPPRRPNRHAERAKRLIQAELQKGQDPEFSAALIPPRKITVNFAGGFTEPCYLVARPKGPYSVVYMPKAGYFSLCVASMFGPVDIGVHGGAMDCYASV